MCLLYVAAYDLLFRARVQRAFDASERAEFYLVPSGFLFHSLAIRVRACALSLSFCSDIEREEDRRALRKKRGLANISVSVLYDTAVVAATLNPFAKMFFQCTVSSRFNCALRE